jgi:predicted TIM-barrel fold metal-dependent hydrolase
MSDDKLPPLSCDCHFHIFGPFVRFPLDPGRHYTPPEASVDAYRAMAGALGLQRMVVVQASPYGTDNRATLEALRAFGPERARAVAVVDETFNTAALQVLADAGVRGVRFNLVSGNGAPEDQILALAKRIAPLGWHMQVYADGAKLAALAPVLAGLPVPVVIDHCGGVGAELGTAHPQFAALLRLLDTGRVWVKTCSYRASSAGAPWDDMATNVRVLMKAAPERCVWGTDWPHTNMDAHPDTRQLLAQFLNWVPETSLRQRVFVDNPAQLYGF